MAEGNVVEEESQELIEQRIERDLGVSVPEFKSYPVDHPNAGTRHEITMYDTNKKAFDLKWYIKTPALEYQHTINYILLPNTKTLARRERKEPLPTDGRVTIQYTDGNFRLEYTLSEAKTERYPDGSFKSSSTRAFMSSITYEQHPDEPPNYRWGRILRNELARLYLDNPGKGLSVSYPSFFTLEEFIELVKNDVDHNETDELRVTRNPLQERLEYLAENPRSPYGYVEKRARLIPGETYFTNYPGYYQMRLDVTETESVFEKRTSQQGPASRIIIPNPKTVIFSKLLPMANGSLDEWSQFNTACPFRVEMLDPGLNEGNSIKRLTS